LILRPEASYHVYKQFVKGGIIVAEVDYVGNFTTVYEFKKSLNCTNNPRYLSF
jgi:hypothetical protein